MRNWFQIIVLSVLPLSGYTQSTYFLDDVAGNDKNRGTSASAAWRTIEKINTVMLNPGDSVLFRRGGQWTGNFIPRGSGSAGHRIVIGSYGNGPLPVLDAHGLIADGEQVSSTIRLFNQEYFEIRDLKIRNFKPFEIPGKIESRGRVSYSCSRKSGIYCLGKDCGTLHDIYFVNLEVCDVNGSMDTKDNGGIFLEIAWDTLENKRVKSNFDGLYTEGCHIHDVDRTGWSNSSVWENRSLTSKWGEPLPDGRIHNWYPSKNVVIRNNKFECAGANALIIRVADSPLVEHCFFNRNGLKGSGNASFPFNCDNTLFQFNEACYTFYNSEADSWDGKKDADAGGFDSDWKCKNTVIQYNYSHHNGDGGILICCDGANKTGFNEGTVIRYNIFENNEHHIIRCSGKVTNNRIYNNVFFSGKEVDSVIMVFHKSWGGYSDSTAYLNNIFYSEGKGNYIDLGKSTRNIFLANTFYGPIINEPEDSLKSKANPLFKGSTGTESNWKNVRKYMLHDESPAINTGISIAGHPGRDFQGNPVQGRPDRGVYETTSESKNVRFLDQVFENVEVQKDIVFGETVSADGKTEQLLLDIYTPAGDNFKNRPAIMWIHGGGFRPGNDKSQSYIVRIARDFAIRGYVCFSINYRIRNNPKDDLEGTINDAVSDAMTGLDWIRRNNEKLGISKEKIIVGGGSAGGMTAVNLCYKDETGKRKWDKKGIIALVDLWGSPDQSRMFSKVDPDDPPTIIVHGTADELVSFANSEQLVKELEKNRIRYELITIEGGKHTPVDHMDDFSGKIAGFLYREVFQLY